MSIVDELRAVAAIAPADVTETDARAIADLWPIGLKRGPSGPRPVAMVRPRTHDAVRAVLQWAACAGRTVTVTGAGTNVVGAVGRDAEVLISLDRLTRIVAFDEVSQILTVEAGALGGEVEQWLRQRGCTIGLYPQSLAISTVGGWVSTRATGTYSASFGGVENLVRGVTFVTPSGHHEVIGPHTRVPGGLDVVGLLCGAEGTLGIITDVSLTVHRIQPEVRVCATFPTMRDGLLAQRELIQQRVRVGLLRVNNAVESEEIMGAGQRADGRCLMIATILGPEDVLGAEHALAQSLITTAGGLIVSSGTADGWYARRYRAAGLMEEENAQPGRLFDTIEVSVPWAAAAACVEALEEEMATITERCFVHSSHAYTSGTCIYIMLWLAGEDDEAVVQKCESAWKAVLDTVERHGGAIGHHHGIGAARAERYHATAAGRIHRAVKIAVDPQGVLRAGILGSEQAASKEASAVGR